MRVVLPELQVPNRRLGRHIHHDPRSLRYLLPDATTETSVSWDRHTAILDQGDTGSCTGNADVGALGCDPLYSTLADAHLSFDETLALSIYSDAEKLDGGAGYPPEDNGSTGLSVAKVDKARGYVSGYRHATSLAKAHAGIQVGPILLGVPWLSSFDDPDSEGIIRITKDAYVRGGHQIVSRQYDASRDLWWIDNSWGTPWGKNGRAAFGSDVLSTLLDNAADIVSLVPIDQPAPTPDPQSTSVSFTADQLAVLDKWGTGPLSARKPSAAWRAARGL